ncbi:hypothetical protein CRG98_022954 [Punica granatum]|uniref:O-methyltransferase domain-containing protein n=1 Tax=Punica granatum TaxID=22663 RepID=A0A2I0JK54_PUNGR|nr:hypothetical protein CRG98_022954 [Punica granatum]
MGGVIWSSSADIFVMVAGSGKERSEKEWAKLFHGAGFRKYEIAPLGQEFSRMPRPSASAARRCSLSHYSWVRQIDGSDPSDGFARAGVPTVGAVAKNIR